MSDTVKKYFPAFTILVMFIFFCIISYNFPLTGDDLNWGVVKLSKYFSNGQFNNYDGRYLGNTLIITVSKLPLLRVILYATTSTLILFLSAFFIDSRKWANYIWLVFILLFTISVPIFNQTWGWNAGFFNYVFGMLYPLYFANILKYYVVQSKRIPKINYVLLPILSILSCFFVEHVTLFNLIIAIFAVYYSKKTKFAQMKPIIFNLIGTIIGFILMFSNKAYLSMLSGSDAYQYRSAGTSPRSIYSAISQKIDFYLLINNITLTTLLTLLIIYILLRKLASSATFTWHLVSFGELAITVVFWIYHYVFFDTILAAFNHRYFISFILTMAFLAVVIFEGILLSLNRKNTFSLIYSLVGFVFLIAPFMVVTPFGPRGAFGSALFLSIFVLVGYEVAIDNIYELLKPLVVLASIILLAFYSGLAIRIGSADRLKEQFITYQQKNKTPKKILYLEVPHSMYYWSVYMQEDNPSYRQFYNIKQVKGQLIPYSEWKAGLKATKNHDQLFKALSNKYLR